MSIRALVVAAVAAALVLPAALAPAGSGPRTIASWSNARTDFPFSTSVRYADARAAIAGAFGGATFLTIDELVPCRLDGVDLLVLDTIGGTELSTDEQTALGAWVDGGGTLLLHAWSTLDPTSAASHLAPFGLEPLAVQNDGSILTHEVLAVADPVLDGPFGLVETFANRFETHLAGFDDSDALVLAADDVGPVLALVPRSPDRLGRVLVFCNFHAFGDPESWQGGLIDAADNLPLLLNLVQTASSSCHADLDDDGAVGTGDLLALLAGWGDGCGCCPADLDLDGNVGTTDLLSMLEAWGACR